MNSFAIDPELERQLSGGAGNVEAVFVLKPSGDAGALLDRVNHGTHDQPADFHVLGNLGVLVVSASPSYIRQLMVQPEVEAVGANHSPEIDA